MRFRVAHVHPCALIKCTTIYMGILSSEDSWALFKRHSLENRDPEEHPKFEEVGKQIADKCKGLPLALKALAGVLLCKSEVDEWRDILRSEIWELSICSNGILPAMMLSYNDLPAHLKQCFAYCAIYPKDYLFCKDQVIHLWIANGLVQQFHSGNQYFLELRSRSLFEMVSKSSERDIEKFLMHDLVNDLAQIASSNICIRLEENKGSHMLEQCRHMSYYVGKYGDFQKLKSLYKSEQLRTLLPINIQFHNQYKLSKRVLHNILPRLRSLRALSLSHYRIKELPSFTSNSGNLPQIQAMPSFSHSLRFEVYRSGISLISNHFPNQYCPPPSLTWRSEISLISNLFQ